MWKPDAQWLISMRETLGHQLRDLTAAGGAAHAVVAFASRALRSVGMLALVGQPDQARDAAASVDDLEAWVARALEDFDSAALDAAAATVVECSPELQLRGGEHELDVRGARATFESMLDLDALPLAGEGGDAAAKVRSALNLRDRVEILLAGAETLLGENLPGLSIEQRVSLEHFEQLVRPQLWRLIPLGHFRAEAVAWIEPHQRARFWWWSQGADVSPEGLDHLAGAALVLARFPEARKALDAMVEAQLRLDSVLKRKAT